MLPRSCDCLSVSRREPQPQPPLGWKRARPAGRGGPEKQAGAPRPPPRGGSPAPLSPLPSPGGRSPYLSEEGRPTRPDTASLRLRLGQPPTPAWLPLPAPSRRPAWPKARPALPLKAGVQGLAAERDGRDPSASPARHFLIRLLKAQSRQPPRRPRRLERACVVTWPARGAAGV